MTETDIHTESSAPAVAADGASRIAASAIFPLLCERFSIFRDVQPLAIGIHKALILALPEVPAAGLKAALHRHTGSTRYLKAVATGDDRFGLDGLPAGKITEEQKQQAATALRERFKKSGDRKREEQKVKLEQERKAAQEQEREEKLQQLAQRFAKR